MASPAVEDSIADARGQCGQLAWPIATGAEQLDLALEVSLICLEKVIYGVDPVSWTVAEWGK